MRPWVFLFGPTAVGKTDLLERLAADGPGFGVISADAFQIYRGCDIGTAKPSASLRTALPHYLLDIRNPDETYSVADFVTDANRAAEEIHAQGRLPVVSGGTAFYYRHLLEGLPQAPPADAAIRQQLEAEIAERGSHALHAELARLDPERARVLHPNDAYRIQRALEIIRSSGQAQSSFAATGRGGLLADSRVRVIILFLERERTELRERIARRVDQMFALGLEAEVAALRRQGYGAEAPAMRAIGYREFFEPDDPVRRRQLIIDHSCQYAKRQMTFFRSFPQAIWVNPDDPDSARELLLRALEAPCP